MWLLVSAVHDLRISVSAKYRRCPSAVGNFCGAKNWRSASEREGLQRSGEKGRLVIGVGLITRRGACRSRAGRRKNRASRSSKVFQHPHVAIVDIA